MTPLLWMVGASAGSAAVLAVVPGLDAGREVVLGMLAPLAGAAGTWILVVRTYGTQPALLTGRMVAAFGAKLLFFGAYVTTVLTALDVRELPFVASFTGYFIGLHLFEAICLQRLFGAGTPAADGGRR